MSRMSELDMLDKELQAIREAFAEPWPETPVLSAEEQIERRADWIIRELDELCALASNAETVDLVEGQQLAIGQMNTRVTLILSFLATRKPRLTVVRNNG